MGTRAYVCQVCTIYDPAKNNRRFSEIFDESKKIAEKKIKEKQIKLEEFEIAELKSDEEIDLSLDEFEEEDEEVPLKFEKRKAGKADLEDTELADITNECPFCGEFFENLSSHIQSCEFAPDDVSIDDIIPKKKKKKKPSSSSPTGVTAGKEEKEKKTCPYCNKEFIRLGRHLNSCPKKPPEDVKNED